MDRISRTYDPSQTKVIQSWDLELGPLRRKSLFLLYLKLRSHKPEVSEAVTPSKPTNTAESRTRTVKWSPDDITKTLDPAMPEALEFLLT